MPISDMRRVSACIALDAKSVRCRSVICRSCRQISVGSLPQIAVLLTSVWLDRRERFYQASAKADFPFPVW